MNQREAIYVILLVLAVFFSMSGLWAIDVAVGAMNTQGAAMTNGWWVRDPIQHYHLGLYTIGLTIVGMAFLMIHIIHREVSDEKRAKVPRKKDRANRKPKKKVGAVRARNPETV